MKQVQPFLFSPFVEQWDIASLLQVVEVLLQLALFVIVAASPPFLLEDKMIAQLATLDISPFQDSVFFYRQ